MTFWATDLFVFMIYDIYDDSKQEGRCSIYRRATRMGAKWEDAQGGQLFCNFKCKIFIYLFI